MPRVKSRIPRKFWGRSFVNLWKFPDLTRSSQMSEHHAHDEHQPAIHHHHDCGNLFGCGDEKGTGVLREDIKDAAVTRRTSDRLLHMDELNQESLDDHLSARGRSRRTLLRASSF